MPNKKPRTEDILLGAFVGVESAHAFSAFEPSVFTIRSLAVPQGAESEIRAGYIPSVAFSLILGGVVSAITKSRLPLYFGLGTSAFMIGVYEVALRYPVAPAASLDQEQAQLVTLGGRRYRIVPEE